MTKTPESESEIPNYFNVKLEYVGNLTKLKMLEQSMNQYDMLLPFIIPKFIDKYNPIVTRPGDAP